MNTLQCICISCCYVVGKRTKLHAYSKLWVNMSKVSMTKCTLIMVLVIFIKTLTSIFSIISYYIPYQYNIDE